jgi:hypothetical protein
MPFLYYADNIPRLTRKHRKLLEFIEKDPYATKAENARVLESGRQATLRS